MSAIRVVSALAVCVVGLSGSLAQAQGGLEKAGVNLGVGYSGGMDGGLRHGRIGPAANVSLNWTTRSPSHHAYLVGLNVTSHTTFYNADDCLIAPGGKCARNFPDLWSAAALGGLELRTSPRGAAFRALVGPAFAHSNESASALGAQIRTDISTAVLGRVALMLWAQSTYLPTLMEKSASVHALGFGLRIR